MSKVDFKSAQKHLYGPPGGVFTEVVVPSMTFLHVDGHGDPNTSLDYRRAVEALFAASYAAKSLSKKDLDHDYVVFPLEGQWWAADMATFHSRDKAKWSWRMMIRQPEWLATDHLDAAVQVAQDKGMAAADKLRRSTFCEGRCIQRLHVGSYDDETPVLADLHDHYLPEHGLQPTGRHHEIYLSDPRRVPPARLRTILRQPVTAADTRQP